MANVVYGDKNKKPWEDHLAYCDALTGMIAEHDRSIPLVVAGDYNQRIPSPRPTRQEAIALDEALRDVSVLTEGEVDGWAKQGIDHSGAAADLRTTTGSLHQPHEADSTA